MTKQATNNARDESTKVLEELHAIDDVLPLQDIPKEQIYGSKPTDVRETSQYQAEYVGNFVDRWDQLIDWDARADGEGRFFIDQLRKLGKQKIIDVACGTGFHSVQLLKAGFNVSSADGNAQMLVKAFENGKKRGYILCTLHADWRWLNRDIDDQQFDAVICLGNSFTHLFDEHDRRRALAEFYSVLKHDGILILDQRNYDSILDKGFSSRHKYYYCGDKVSAEPIYVDEGLTRFEYTFEDGSKHHLNMFPLRKDYTRKLIVEAGFQQVETYGDFQETYRDDEPDFFIHVAQKSYEADTMSPAASVSESYYDSSDADRFYELVWGGEDIHIGLYEAGLSIFDASRRTVELMSRRLKSLTSDSHVLDLGAGYGGAARYLAREFGCRVNCVNISEVQNDRNRKLNIQQGLDQLVEVRHGSFESIPSSDRVFNVVWSQDAFLHSDKRERIVSEIARVTKPGGEVIFTDPMQADDCPAGVLQPVYDRLSLTSLASFSWYRQAMAREGFDELDSLEMTGQLRTHYAMVRENLEKRYDELTAHISREYMDKMLLGLENWVNAADKGYLAWGVLHFVKKK